MTELGEKKRKMGIGHATTLNSERQYGIEVNDAKDSKPGAGIRSVSEARFGNKTSFSTPPKIVAIKEANIGLDCSMPSDSRSTCIYIDRKLRFPTQQKVAEVSPDIMENTTARNRCLESETSCAAFRCEPSLGCPLSVKIEGSKCCNFDKTELLQKAGNTSSGDYLPPERFVSADSEDVVLNFVNGGKIILE